jgi:hypothetical protein
MFVKCLKQWHRKRPGEIWDHPRGAARVLIKRGFAEEAADPSKRQTKRRKASSK